MEFEFRRDVTGELQAHFSMGHEAMASWVQDEVGHRLSVLPEIYKAIEALQQLERWEFCLEGLSWNLRLSRSEAEVRNANIDFDADDMTDTSDDLDYYDDEQHCTCGLDDFRAMLIEWQAFVGRT